MSEQRWEKESPTPGEDPREIDREKSADEALDDLPGQEGMVHRQEPTGGMGTSSDAPGRNLSDLRDADAPEVREYRDRS